MATGERGGVTLYRSLLTTQPAAMETPLRSSASCEVRSVIRFLTAKNFSASEIHNQICEVYGEHAMSVQMVRRWRVKFLEGRESVHDQERSGRPSTSRQPDAIAAVQAIVDSDKRVTLDEIMDKLPPNIELSRTSIYSIMTEELQLTKVCARWVPRLLSDVHKERRKSSAQAFQQLFRAEGDDLFTRIVTGDETWIHHFTPESKRQSMVWQKKGDKAPQKAKVVESSGKVMATVFWDCRGVLLVDYLPRGETINAERYCGVLKKLRRAIQNKRRGLLSRKVLFIHDNARPHAARATVNLLDQFRWDVFDHPPYSPDLAPSDFHLFPVLKGHLGGRRFANNDELENEVNTWFKSMAADWYAAGLKNLLPRYEECVKRDGNYVEK